MGAGASSAGGGGQVWAARLGECCAKHVTATEREAVWSGADGDGPSSAVSRQAVASGVLSWTLRVSGEPRIILGAAPAEFGSGATAGLACAPPVPGWAVGHGVSDASGKGEMTRVTCKEGDRFAVAADLTNGRLTIHQAPEHGTGSGRWRKVLDTPTLTGAVRLCVCCFGGPATVELLDLRDQIRWQMETIYREHNARKLTDVDALLNEWQGEEAALLANIQDKYQADAGERARHAGEVRHQLVAIYSEHNPAKLGDVDGLVAEWAGQEELLLAKVQAKYLGGDDIRSQIVAIYTEHCPRKLGGMKF